MSHVEPIATLPPGAAGSGVGSTSDLFFLAYDELRRLYSLEDITRNELEELARQIEQIRA